MKHYVPIPAFDEVALTFEATFKLDFAADPDGGYVLASPELPGFEAWGSSPAAARQDARTKLIDYLSERAAAGEPVPLARYRWTRGRHRRHRHWKHPGFAA